MSMVELKRTLKEKVADYFEKHSAEFTCAMASVYTDVNVAEMCELCRK